MRGSRLIHLWGPLTHCCEKKKESVNQFAKIGNLCSESAVIKNFSIIAEVPTITAFVAAFDAKALNRTELLESYLADGNSLKHRKKKKAERNQLIPLKPIENLPKVSIVHYSRVSYFFRLVRIECNYTVAWKDVELKIRTVASRGGLNFRKGTWHSESLIKSLLICSVSYLNLERLSSPMPTVAIGLV